MSGRRRIVLPLACFVLLAAVVGVLPTFISDFRAQQLAYVAIYLTAILGLNILTGYTGQISLGHGAFMAIGGYTTAILMSEGQRDVLPLLDSGMKDVWTIPIAAVVAGVAGFLFGIPALRLSGLYLALATFAVAVATPAVIKKFEHFTGGGPGINLFGTPELTASVTPVRILGVELDYNNWLYALSWTVALIAYVAVWLILRGRTGRAFRAVRDSETAAVSSGVSLARYKTLAFAVSAAFAGAAGALFTVATTFVNPDTFPIALSINLLVGVVVGGLGSLSGLIAGAVLIVFLPIWAQDANTVIPDWLPFLGGLDTNSPGAPAVVFGVVLILLMFVLPTGFGGLLHRFQSLTTRVYDRSKTTHAFGKENTDR
jgi:branched-chain amino acid transport system permease protein